MRMVIFFCMLIIFMVLTMILFFLIFLLPSIDDNLFLLSSQIDRFSMNEGCIEFFYIISSNVFFSTSCEVSLYNIRKCVYKYIERFTIFFFHMVSVFSFGNFLEIFYDRSGSSRTKECKFFSSRKFHYYIRHSK